VIVDTSALVAILFQEPDARTFVDAITAAGTRRMSAASLFETALVVDRRGDAAASDRLDPFIAAADIEIVAVDAVTARLARDAYRRFGKGNHAAKLNFGDCFAYALAEATGEPLLFKGDDFSKTDVAPAL
jgi:ribonuclease VapC